MESRRAQAMGAAPGGRGTANMKRFCGYLSLLALASVFVIAGPDTGARIVLIGGLAVLCSALALLALLFALQGLWPLRRRGFGDWL